MQIQIRHDATIPGDENLAARVRATVEDSLERFAHQITTVEVHLADENGPKHGGDEFRCSLEVRVEGRKPIAVTHKDTAFELAVETAADKMARMLEHQLGKLRDDHQPLNPDKAPS
ncbi:MAG: HPF/RaiA family ribosome-associated protein [Kofleriaceae bacterium]